MAKGGTCFSEVGGQIPVVFKPGSPEPSGGHPKDGQGLAACQAAVGVGTLSTVVRSPLKKELGWGWGGGDTSGQK